jgi:hypothetical protein
MLTTVTNANHAQLVNLLTKVDSDAISQDQLAHVINTLTSQPTCVQTAQLVNSQDKVMHASLHQLVH